MVTLNAMQAAILCYHKVGSLGEEGRRLNIDPARLASHVRYFSRKRYNFVCAGELASKWPAKPVCFTFDDAYESTMVNAPPIFEAVGARATFYAVPKLVGKHSDWDGELRRPLAGWVMLRDAQSRGHEIGNHSLTHADMSAVSEETLKQETKTARERFEFESICTSSFCYPYGRLDIKSVDAVRRAGYRVAVRIGKRQANLGDDLLMLPRVVMAYSDALPMLLYKLYLKPRFRRRD